MMQAQNPFFEPFTTPHGTMPFNRIAVEDYEPAIREGMARQNREIDTIINNPQPATFQNTVLALEKSGRLLQQVENVFGNLLSAETNDAMQELAKKLMPLLDEHANNIGLNEKLFARVKAVYEQRQAEGLTAEQLKLVEETYEGFIRNGVNLQGADEARMEAFRDYLTGHGIFTTIRASRGQDIYAACGLLSTARREASGEA